MTKRPEAIVVAYRPLLFQAPKAMAIADAAVDAKTFCVALQPIKSCKKIFLSVVRRSNVHGIINDQGLTDHSPLRCSSTPT